MDGSYRSRCPGFCGAAVLISITAPSIIPRHPLMVNITFEIPLYDRNVPTIAARTLW